MRLLLDTHTLAWWLLEIPKLSRAAYNSIASASEVSVSAISAFEMATKSRLGKWPGIEILTLNFESRVEADGFRLLPVTPAHAVRAGHMKGDHRDPFDRILAAQAAILGLVLVSQDREFAGFGLETLW